MYRRILMPLDGSHRAEQALLHAVSIARCFDSTLVLLGVVEETVSPAGEPQPELSEEIISRYLESVAERLRPDGPETEVAVVEGSPAEAILSYARDGGVDLIVMSSHGRSQRNRPSYGIVAERVLRESPIPALLVRSAPSAGQSSAET